MVYMKKFICSLASSVIAFTTYAAWSPIERNTYFEDMFQVTMEYDTYGTFLDTIGTIDAINCIGDYYETNYTFDEWHFIFNTGTDNTLEEYYAAENICLLEALDLQDARRNKLKENI